MKTENSRSRKLIFMVISCAFIACAMLMTFVACDNKEIDDSNDGVKPARTNHLSYELIKNEYAIDEEVTVKLAYGTCMMKEGVERYILDSAMEDTSVELFALNEDDDVSQSWKENPTKTLILKIEDFYRENYPYPSETVEVETTEVAIPKTLFVGNKGKIELVMDAYGDCCCAFIYYQIKDGKICLSKEAERNGDRDVIIVYREDVEK